MATLTSNEEEVIRTDEDGVALQDRDHFRETNLPQATPFGQYRRTEKPCNYLE